MADIFVKTLKATFVSLNAFMNKVQDMGCIERSFLSYNIVSSIDDRAVISPYYSSVKKLFEDLQDILNMLQNSSQASNSDLTMPFNDEETSCGKEISEQYVEQNILEESLPSSSHCLKANKYRAPVQFPSCKDLSHSPSRDPFLKPNVYLPDGESSKQFSQLVAFQETACLSSSLVTPFENMALNATVQSASVCDNANKQTISGDAVLSHASSLSDPASSMYAPLVTSHCRTAQIEFNQSAHSHMTSMTCSVINHTLNPGKSALKTNGSVPSKISFDSPLEEYGSDLKSRPSPKSKKRRVKFSHPCLVCDRVFNTWKHLSIHVKKVHSDEDSHEIPPISDRGSSSSSFECGAKPSLPLFCCKTCNSASSTLSNFQIHLCRLPTEESQANPSLSNRILITNMRKLQEMKKFVCECCGVEFRSLKRVLYHLPRCSPGPYPCNICASIFLTLKDLNYHKKKSHRGEKCFTCDECAKSFVRRASLRKHCINKHESKALLEGADSEVSMSYRCDLCPKKFIKKIFLTNHKLRVHGLDKKFLCQVCGKKFMTNNSLMLHIDIHKGEKKFECQYCDRRFRRKEKLLHHERIHTGERPFECSQCAKAFVSRARLNEHIRRHEAEKRFACPQCDRTYASAFDLKKHMRKKHNLQMPTQYIKVVLRKADRVQTQNSMVSETLPVTDTSLPSGIHQSSSVQICNALPFPEPMQTLCLHPVDTQVKDQAPLNQQWSNTIALQPNPGDDFSDA